MKLKTFRILLFTICIAILLSIPTYAYIDPSAMTYIIQIIAGSVIAVSAVFGFYFRKLKRFITKRFGKEDKKIDTWQYNKNDDDTFGLCEYPILDCDRYSKEELLQEQTVEVLQAKPISDDFQEFYDKYDERGIDPVLENLYLRTLVSEERNKRNTVEEGMT